MKIKKEIRENLFWRLKILYYPFMVGYAIGRIIMRVLGMEDN